MPWAGIAFMMNNLWDQIKAFCIGRRLVDRLFKSRQGDSKVDTLGMAVRINEITEPVNLGVRKCAIGRLPAPFTSGSSSVSVF
jgi:hypothetical protein